LFLPVATAVLLAAPPPADLVVRNARIHTGDPARPAARDLAVRGARLAYVGPDARAHIGKRTRVVDLRGAFLMPAFHDAHVHPVDAGVEMGQCDLNAAESVADILATVEDYRRKHPRKAWIVGSGWSLTAFPGGNPGRDLLDRAVADRPVFLWSSDGHSAWLNSLALRKAGITARTQDPPAGRIERDPRSGEPSGTLRETAMDLASKLLPPATPGEVRRGLARAQDILARYGIVSIQEAAADASELSAYADFARRGKLKVRVRAAQDWDDGEPHAVADRVKTLVGYRKAFSGPGFAAAAAKLFVDGVIEARTASLLAPYLLDGKPVTGPDALGKPTYSSDRLDAMVERLDAAGFQIHLHAIGDGGVRMGLDALERAARKNGPRDRRPVLAHLQLSDPADLPRFKALGAVACIQPYWHYPDEFVTRLTTPFIGAERTARLYPAASLLAAGARVAGGSDWSVTTANPLEAIQIAVTRQDPEKAGAILGEGERLTVAQALASYTQGGAWANFEDRDGGVLAAGKWADFVVLDRDPFAVRPHEIGRIAVKWTVREGRTTFRRSSHR